MPDIKPTESVTNPRQNRWWIGPAAVAITAAFLLVCTWGTWVDLLVDFGVQLYVPWQITQGHVLYRDIAHYTGPLSIYYNALAFLIAGASLRTLVIANLPVLAGIIALIYYLLSKIAGRLAATVGGISLLILFAFAHLTPAGNYNYVCPYEYEYTHAMFLCLAAIALIWQFLKTQRIAYTALAGFMVGLVFLTRAEFFTAITAACILAFILQARRRPIRLAASSFIIALAIPPILSTLLLSLAMPLPAALHGTLGMWPAMLRGDVARQTFYRNSMGIADPLHSLLRILYASIPYLATYGLFRKWPAKFSKTPLAYALPAIVAVAIYLAAFKHYSPQIWISMFCPLPLFLALLLFLATIRSFRIPDPAHQSTAPLIAIFALFSFLLLGKIILYTRIIQYGWTLAMPATMLLIAGIFGLIPRQMRKQNLQICPYLSGMLGAWAVILVIHLNFTLGEIKFLKYPVGQGPDQFLANNKARYVNTAIDIASQLPPGKTLACFPEGIMINYLARRPAPPPYVNYNPPDLLLFGEPNMLRALQSSPPDYIMLVHKDTSEFGVPHFSRDYGQSLGAYIRQYYRELPLPKEVDLGPPPLQTNVFGIRVLYRNR